MKKGYKELDTLEMMIKRVRTAKTQLKNKERALRGTLDESLEEKVINLRRMLIGVKKDRKLHQNFRLISKFG